MADMCKAIKRVLAVEILLLSVRGLNGTLISTSLKRVDHFIVIVAVNFIK